MPGTFNISEELKKLPDKPGVYIMHDADDAVLYVGKAVVLKNRVRQYFQAGYKRSPKIEKMVSHIARFEYIVTDSETEALVLECNLIKEYRPPYNTMLTDDKAYPFIRISVSEEYPRIFLAHKLKRDGAKYFGPYTSRGAVKDAIKLTQRLYHVRSCSRRLPQDIGKARPCLNYHLGLCKAPCQGYISQEEYAQSIKKALDFLNGNYAPVRREAKEKMLEASEKLDFEGAAAWRDLIKGISALEECQKISDVGGDDRDIIALALDQPAEAEEAVVRSDEAGESRDAIAQIFFVRDGKLIGRDHFHLRVADFESAEREHLISTVIKQYYAGTPFLPHEILIEKMPEDAGLLQKWLGEKAGRKVALTVPERGDKAKLLKLAGENAHIILSRNKEQIKREEARTSGALRELASMLGIPQIVRTEAYDISNISGFLSVGSMVVFENGKPKKNDYRKFRIKTVEGPNDYASLYEVITRRFSHGLTERNSAEQTSFSAFPDLVMMDGGKGQVKMAEDALAALGLDIPVCGMVKDDNHRTRGLYFRGAEVPIDKKSEVFNLITRVQDEAHRFAIEYHRSLRGKGQVHSILDDIDGIGPARRKALMRTFGTVEAMKEASLADLLAIPEINRPAAIKVYAFFHDGEIPEE